MNDKEINLALVAQVAHGLKELRERMVFVGGAVISLYTDDPAANEVRVTTDIDMTINLTNFSEYAEMQERLAELNFYPDHEGHAICTYKYEKIDIDIMSADDSGMGPANKWYKPGFEYIEEYTLPAGININILSAPYFLATKLEAFKNRGENDFYGCADYEDIIYLLDNRSTIADEVINADADVREYIRQQLGEIRNHPQANEILGMHIPYNFREERLQMLIDKIDLILR